MNIRAISFLSLLSGAAMLAGCATATPVPLPSGQQGFAIEGCDSMAECYKKAAETCGGGKYEIVGQNSKTVGSVSGAGGVVSGVMVPQYSMTIECKPGGESTPRE